MTAPVAPTELKECTDTALQLVWGLTQVSKWQLPFWVKEGIGTIKLSQSHIDLPIQRLAIRAPD